MPFTVILGHSARADLVGIGAYIAEHHSSVRARYVLDQIEDRVSGLADLPNRGPIVSELLTVGISDFREVSFRPYRIIYEVTDNEVHVHLIADGRRDMNTLLMRRLLQA